MKCIKCHKEMTKFVYNNIIIDQCPQCLGVWLDKNELCDLLYKIRAKKNTKDFDNLEHSVPSRNQREDMSVEHYIEKFFEQSKESDDNCPRCNKKLKIKLLYNNRIEMCETCKGLFLDKLELKNVYDNVFPKKSLWLYIISKVKRLFKK